MTEQKSVESVAAEPLSQLRARVEQAAKLIGQLRETNYALTGELARLKRELSSADTDELSVHSPSSPPPLRASASTSSDMANTRLELLLEERQLVRDKVRSILGRLESLDATTTTEST